MIHRNNNNTDTDTKEQDNLKKVIKKVIKDNPVILERYQGGQKGLIGFFMKTIMKKSTMSFFSKDSKQKLVYSIKTQLSQTV